MHSWSGIIVVTLFYANYVGGFFNFFMGATPQRVCRAKHHDFICTVHLQSDIYRKRIESLINLCIYGFSLAIVLHHDVRHVKMVTKAPRVSPDFHRANSYRLPPLVDLLPYVKPLLVVAYVLSPCQSTEISSRSKCSTCRCTSLSALSPTSRPRLPVSWEFR